MPTIQISQSHLERISTLAGILERKPHQVLAHLLGFLDPAEGMPAGHFTSAQEIAETFGFDSDEEWRFDYPDEARGLRVRARLAAMIREQAAENGDIQGFAEMAAQECEGVPSRCLLPFFDAETGSHKTRGF